MDVCEPSGKVPEMEVDPELTEVMYSRRGTPEDFSANVPGNDAWMLPDLDWSSREAGWDGSSEDAECGVTETEMLPDSVEMERRS